MSWVNEDSCYGLIARCYELDSGESESTPLQFGKVCGFFIEDEDENHLLVSRFSRDVIDWINYSAEKKNIRTFCQKEDLACIDRKPEYIYKIFKIRSTDSLKTVSQHSDDNIVLRSLNQGDLAELNALYSTESENDFLDLDFDRAEFITKPHLAAFIDGNLVGVVGVYGETEAEVEIGRMFTHPEFRRKGILKKLMVSLIDAFRRGGDKRAMVSWVMDENTQAINLFESLQFQVLGSLCVLEIKSDEIGKIGYAN